MSKNNFGNKGWVSATRSRPCPICRANKWCRLSSDGRIVSCRHQEQGAYKTITDKNGAPMYVHRVNGTGGTLPSPAPVATYSGPELGDSDTLNEVYSAMLDQLSLTESHRANLRKRGLSDDHINRVATGHCRSKTARPSRKNSTNALARSCGACRDLLR
jgi:hypothetical protein